MTPGITLWVSLGAALAAGAGLAGWLVPGAPADATLAIVRHAGAAATAAPLERPSGALAADVDALETDLAVPPPASARVMAAPRRPVGLTPAPMAHDIAPVFRERASAIVRLPNGRLAVLIAAGAGDAHSRLLHVGELFDDRWRLAGLTMSDATLADGTSVEHVPLFGEAVGAGASRTEPQ